MEKQWHKTSNDINQKLRQKINEIKLNLAHINFIYCPIIVNKFYNI